MGGALEMSKNPNNPTNSPVVQALLDAKDNGFPANLVDSLLDFADKNKNTLKSADDVFKKRNYPKSSITWSRIYNNIEIEKILTTNEFILLVFLIKNMWTNNLVQVSQADIIHYTSITSKGIANTAIHSLINKGCITIKFEGNNRQKTVYMINPLLGTVGVEHKNTLTKAYWELTGTKFGDKEQDTQYSDAHKNWLELTAMQHYYRGRNSKENINFNEIKEKEQRIKEKDTKKKSKSKNNVFDEIDSIADTINEDLPF